MSKTVMKQALDALQNVPTSFGNIGYTDQVGDALASLQAAIDAPSKFNIGDMVKKRSGSEWTGKVVGHYSTALTPVGCCVESSSHAGSVQIYPESALEATINQGELNLAKLQTWLPYDEKDDLK